MWRGEVGQLFFSFPKWLDNYIGLARKLLLSIGQ